ncbi:hypothetical protein PINS_up018272, partial [Pythium insidiosum]
MPLLTAAIADAMALRDEEDDASRAAPSSLERPMRKSVMATSPTRRSSRDTAFLLPSDGDRDRKPSDEDDDEADDGDASSRRPLSPRVRKRLDEAKENESVLLR